ncbi:sigma factor-like helix-turn-helix DNA-binding protein [Actinacidiphila glaucinigra]|uniref:sigma factor-like helix-turn-helix DNA-binding protein n=1 Tax=Actinacidiphila glaucinigra TaxID=235986 RepID=UPI0035DD7AB4
MNGSPSRIDPVHPVRCMGEGHGDSPAIRQAAYGETVLARFDREAMPFLGPLYAAATQMAYGRADPDDLVQQTYQRAFKAFETLPEGADVKVWLFRILADTALVTFGKPNRPQDLVFQPPAGRPQEGCDQRSMVPGDHAGRVTQRLYMLPDEDVSAALRHLPAEVRIVVYLADAEGFTTADVAEILGILPGSVRPRLRHGRSLLLETLTAAALRRGLLG